MPGHTHSLDTFSESTVSQSSLAANAWTHSPPGHIFREHCQPVQFGRKCLDTLTIWTHFQRALSASQVWWKMPGHTHSLGTFAQSTVSQSSLVGNATHSQPGHIFRVHCQPVQFGGKCHTLTAWTHFHRAMSASPVWQEMPGHTHSLDTFSESTVSHWQSSLAAHAWTHSQSGHIFREHCQPVQFGRKYHDTLTAWAHFQRALSASPVCQEMPRHTHRLDTFSESTVNQSSLAANV